MNFFRGGSRQGPRDGSQPARTSDAQQANESLRQTLRELGGAGALTPESLADLAQRAGLADPRRVAGLMGLDAGARAVPQHIFFVLGDDECALPASTVQGVERIADVTRVPNTASWVLGVVQVWGTIVSVVDLRAFVGLPPQPLTGRSRLLVVSQRGMSIGFVVDAVTEMRPLGELAVAPVDGRLTPAWTMPYAQGRIQVDGHTVTLLDPDRLLFNEKVQRYRSDAG